MVLVAGMLVALLALPVWAQAAGSNHKAEGGEFAALTPDQRAAIKPIVEDFHKDMKALRATLKTAHEKLVTDRKAGADEATIKADREAVKAAFEAVKARVHTFLTALKPLLPAEAYDKFVASWEKELKGIKDRLEEHREGGHSGSNAPAQK
jgi:hypothetical protein